MTDFGENDSLLHIFGRVDTACDLKQEHMAHNFNLRVLQNSVDSLILLAFPIRLF